MINHLKHGISVLVVMMAFSATLCASSCPEELPEAYRTGCQDCPELFTEGIEFFKQRKASDALQAWLPVVARAEELRDYPTLACLYPKISRLYSVQGEYSKAIEFSLSYVDLPEEFIPLSTVSKQNGNLSEYYGILGLWDEAYKHHLVAYDKALQSGDTLTMVQVLHQSGTVFYYQDSATTSLQFYQEALDLALDQGDQRSLNKLYGGMASAAQAAGQLSNALTYAQSQYETAARPIDRAYGMQNIGDVFWAMGMTDSAFVYLNRALTGLQNQGLAFPAAKLLGHMGDLALELEQGQEAEAYYSSALAIPSYAESPFAQSTYQGLAQITGENGQFEQQAEYLGRYIELHAIHQKDGSQELLDKLRAEFQLENKESQLLQLQQAYEIKQLENFLIIGGAIALLLMLLGGGFYYYSLRQSHKITKEQKEKIEEQNEQLVEYNSRLKGFSSVVSHDLKQPLRTTVSLIGLFRRRFGKMVPEEGREYLELIDQQHKQMLQLIEGLQQLSTLEKPSAEEYRQVDAHDLLQNALHQLQQLAKENDTAVSINPPACDWPALHVHPAQITQVWQNLLANAIKFSPATVGEVVIGYEEKEASHLFFVQDNGIGISKEHHDKVFGMFSRLNARSDYEGSGIGLATCKRILDNHSGRIWVESALGQGSTFYFELPHSVNTAPQAQAVLQES